MNFVSLARGGLTALCQKDLRKYIFSDISKPCTERLPLSEQNPKKEVFQPHLPGTATLLRLSPSYHFRPRPLLPGHGLQAPAASMA